MKQLSQRTAAYKLLQLYFDPDQVDRRLDYRMQKVAAKSATSLSYNCADKLCDLVSTKEVLSLLYNYIEDLCSIFTEEQKKLLERYIFARKNLDYGFSSEERAIVRAAFQRVIRHVKIEEIVDYLEILDTYVF